MTDMERHDTAKQALRNFTCALFAVLAAGVLTAGFIVNPRGEIHSSVLIAFGECLTFVAAVFGIDFRPHK